MLNIVQERFLYPDVQCSPEEFKAIMPDLKKSIDVVMIVRRLRIDSPPDIRAVFQIADDLIRNSDLELILKYNLSLTGFKTQEQKAAIDGSFGLVLDSELGNVRQILLPEFFPVNVIVDRHRILPSSSS